MISLSVAILILIESSISIEFQIPLLFIIVRIGMYGYLDDVLVSGNFGLNLMNYFMNHKSHKNCLNVGCHRRGLGAIWIFP